MYGGTIETHQRYFGRYRKAHKILGKVAVGIVRESGKSSGHPYIGRIARSSLRYRSFLVIRATAYNAVARMGLYATAISSVCVYVRLSHTCFVSQESCAIAKMTVVDL